MPNRAERRKAAKDQRRGVPSQYDQTRGRARSGMLDEYALQEKSRRIQEGVDDSGVWKPSARTEVDEEVESVFEANPNYQDPKAFKAPHSVRQWFRVGSWTLIALSVIAFFVVMWLPTHPLWLILTVSVVFVVGVLSLFFTATTATTRTWTPTAPRCESLVSGSYLVLWRDFSPTRTWALCVFSTCNALKLYMAVAANKVTDEGGLNRES